jgi:hypothetical protein
MCCGMRVVFDFAMDEVFEGWKAMKPPPRLGGDVTGFLGHGVEDAIALAPSSFEIVSFQGEAMADPATLGCYQTSPGPPGAVVVPEVVVWIFLSATCNKCECIFWHNFEI